jgi:hypothetical protein
VPNQFDRERYASCTGPDNADIGGTHWCGAIRLLEVNDHRGSVFEVRQTSAASARLRESQT